MSLGLLLSGGMDSISIAYWKKPTVAITLDYGQKCASTELRTSAKICRELGISHEAIKVDCSSLGSGDLAGTPQDANAPSSEWWPYRNQMLITLAAMRGISLGIEELMIGSVKSDESHVDGRPTFVDAMNHVMTMQEGNMRITAPAIEMTTPELVEASGITPDILCWAHSCHTGDHACGVCRGCNKHRETMIAIGYGNY